MNTFSITVRSEKEDKRIPVSVASDVMSDVQMLLSHIGESLISEEFGSYKRPDASLIERFTLFINPDSGGISFRSSAGKGESALMDKAVAKLKAVIDKMGSGSGTYWMEDAFKDPCYRCTVMYDLIRLSRHMSSERGYTLLFSADGKERVFMPVDIKKSEAFLEKNAMTAEGEATGILHSIPTKRNIPMYGLTIGGDRVKISFFTKEAEETAAKCVNGAVVVKGTLRYTEDGELSEIADINSIGPFTVRQFGHMISGDRDIPLTKKIGASVGYDNDKAAWDLRYPDLGISVSDADWDDAVAAFHDHFVFIYDNYIGKDNSELSDDEKDVKNALISLTS